MTTSRRNFLAGTAAAALASGLATRPAVADTPTLPPPDQSGIDHIVVVMMENRSFDHFLGWLPAANGKQAGLTYFDSANVAHSTHHLTDPQGCAHPDPDHSFEGGRVEFDNGACDGWLRAGQNDDYAIGYYRALDLPFYNGAAPYWTACDNYFAAMLGPTFPNRLYQHSAQTDRLSNTATISTLPTIWDRLAAAGLTGRYYFVDAAFTALWGTKYADISVPFAGFLSDCAAGTLPELSFVDPKFLDEGTGTSADDHPHADIGAGQFFLNQIYEAVTSGPAWENTLLVINYDEWGGFFDHVPPPIAPDDNPDGAQRGFRVPCLVISPRARRRHIASNVYDHTSVLKAVEWRWNLPPLTVRDSAARNIAEVLNFSGQPDLTAPRFDVPQVVGSPCTTLSATDFAEWISLRDLAGSMNWPTP